MIAIIRIHASTINIIRNGVQLICYTIFFTHAPIIFLCKDRRCA
uniref:7TM GPCR serpentine receptor class x (Srx) domain-containing protein n=1 Tax=Ascaris lumbricoides TaxID=6252 RepID=A0A0M3IEY2_ASCLU